MRIVGVDPGLGGALVLLEQTAEERVRYVDCHDMPRTVRTAGAQKEVADCLVVKALLLQWQPHVVACEFTHAQPLKVMGAQRKGMGAVSAYNFGYSASVIETTTLVLGIELKLVSPQSWKATMGLRKQDKRASLAMAQRMFPTAPLQLVKHEARAEAMLIAVHVLTKEGRVSDAEIQRASRVEEIRTTQALL